MHAGTRDGGPPTTDTADACERASCCCMQVDIFTSVATIDAVYNGQTPQADSIGSLAGGRPLTVAVGGAFLDSAVANNVVKVGGMPCPITAMPNRGLFTCRAPPVTGFVKAEYWNVQKSVSTLPELQTWSNPRKMGGAYACATCH